MSLCAWCGLEAHRYSPGGKKKPDPVACVNMLRDHIRVLNELVGRMVVAGEDMRVGEIRKVLEAGPSDLSLDTRQTSE